ncbi:MAG: NrsF family protein [Methylococcales bacterium]
MTNRKRSDLINDLSKDLAVVNSRNRMMLPAFLWFICSWMYVIASSLYLGPARANAYTALLSNPQFAFESLAGLLASALFCIIAFRESIPGLRSQWLILIAFFSAIVWVGCYVVDLSFPAIEPSLLGKRAHCVLEAYLYSGPPLFIGYWLIYQRYSLDSIWAGLFLGICAGMLPALSMQIVCMYNPQHILTHHIGPILLIALSGALIGKLFPHRCEILTTQQA